MGVIIVYNLMIGLSTPPYGLCIFTVAKVGRVDPSAVIREVMPMWIPMLITLLAVTFIPQVTLWLPTALFG
jgi:C4-dicarboxylate transporter DctM subunit